MYPTLCERELEVQSYPTAHGASLSTERHGQDWRDSGVSAAVLGGIGIPIIPDPPQHGVSIHQTAQGGLEGHGCIRRSLVRS